MEPIWQNQPATYIESVIGSHQQYLELSVMVHWRVKYWKGLQPFNIGSNQPERKKFKFRSTKLSSGSLVGQKSI